jgi:hypothetical protein
MTIEFLPGHFAARDDALASLKGRGLQCFDSDIGPQDLTGDAHAHPFDVEIYMLDGVFELTDCDAGRTHRLERGCKAVVPAGTRHAEFTPAGFHAVFGVSGDLGDRRSDRVRPLAVD